MTISPMTIAAVLNNCRINRDSHDATITGIAYAISARMHRYDPEFDIDRFRTIAGCYQNHADNSV